jgi:hypothetical protein
VLDRPAYEQLLLAKAEIMIRGAVYADSTREFYRQNWVWFEQWCEDAGRQSLPASAETIVLALTSLLIAPKKLATVGRESETRARPARWCARRTFASSSRCPL